MFQNLIQRINTIGINAEDEPLLKNQKNFVMYEAILMSIGGLMWGVICLVLDKNLQSIIPLGYVVLSFFNILIFNHYKDFKFTQAFQTGISLLLPFVFQWTMGGFLASGISMLWAILSLAASLSYSSVKTSALWMATFVILTVFSGIFDNYFKNLFPADYSTDTVIFLITFNIAFISTLIFLLIVFYVSENYKSYLKVKEAQMMMVQSEKLAALGQLSAGIAHEINTPLGAIKALSNEMSTGLHQAHINLFNLLNKLDDKKRNALIHLITHHNIKREFLSTREERAYKKQLREQLESHNISDAEFIADKMVQIDLLAMDQCMIDMAGSHCKDCIQVLYDFFIVQKNNYTILSSVEKASRIVNSLKMYVYSAENSQPVSHSFKESIQSILIIYQNQLKSGIQVVVNIPDDLLITGYPDELGQVWTNLIVNACQAMNFKGELGISAKEENNKIIIAVADTGSGIDPKIGNKIFDEFFSTKKIGEGSGLGLSIVKKIIDKHNGKIYFDSEVGRGTTFYVELPKSQMTNNL
jgi:signal transduction histidine kinase